MSQKGRSSSQVRDSPDSREDKQDRKFVAVLYPDAEDYDIIDVLRRAESAHQWAYILHDKDYNDEGELKKPHYHLLLRYLSPSKLSTVANRLGIPSQYIQISKSFKASERYLVHRTPDSFDKYQYPVKSVFTNISSYTYDVGETNECTALSVIYSILDTEKLNLGQLARYLATQYNDPAIYAAFRRNFNIIKYVYEERKWWEAEDRYKQTQQVCVDMNLINEILSKERNKK